MPLDPPESKASRRIILPGDAPEPAEAPRAPEPVAEDGPGVGSKIVLPPGASLDEEPEDLPEHPRLRPLEIVPIRSGDQDLLLISDPQGVIPSPIALRIEVLDLLQLLDGTLSLNEISALVARESKDLRASRFVRGLISQLDRLLLLDSPRFLQAHAAIREEYHRLEIRPAALEGISYPADPTEAGNFLAEHFARAEAMRAESGGGSSPAPATPRALLVPHLDPRRAGAAIARGYLELDARAREPLRVIVYGVGHALFGELVALTRKHFETPFGKLLCDTRFVDALAARLGPAAYHAETTHRDEHSIEFQALYLKHRFRDRPLTLVPILCGGFHGLLADGRDPRGAPELEALIDAVRETERAQGGATLHVAGVDLSHVGARFGDPALDERTLGEVEAGDRAAVEAARRGDAEGWHQAIASHQDSTRICGWAATYVMLRSATPGEGRLLHYEQSSESDGSMVSVATLAWP